MSFRKVEKNILSRFFFQLDTVYCTEEWLELSETIQQSGGN